MSHPQLATVVDDELEEVGDVVVELVGDEVVDDVEEVSEVVLVVVTGTSC